MNEVLATWAEVVSRLGLLPTGPIEDGLRYSLQVASADLEVQVRSMRKPATVRVIVRASRAEGSWLVCAPHVAAGPGRWRTGDAAFDEQVAVLAGGKVLLPRLGRPERERLVELVRRGAVVGAEESTIEPAILEGMPDAREVVSLIRDLMRTVVRLAVDPPVEELVDRWGRDDHAPMVEAAVQRRVVELMPSVSEAQAEVVCRMLVERGADAAMPLLPLMPPYPCVLAAWFEVGDALDQRVAARVVDAWASGTPKPAARYLAWLLDQPELQAAVTADKLAHTPGLLDDAAFVREFLRAVRKSPPTNALPLLLRIRPRSSSITRRVARALSAYDSPEVDRRLLEWASGSSGGVRLAAAAALADRVAMLLAGKEALAPRGASPSERLEPIRRAAERSSELMVALLERVTDSRWLATIRPHGEPDAIALIRRLGLGGADVDEALLFWLDRGTLPVRLEAAHALGSAGSGRVLASLRERAASWFSDGGVREACRAAGDRIRDRVGGAGALALAPLGGGELAAAEGLRLVHGGRSGDEPQDG